MDDLEEHLSREGVLAALLGASRSVLEAGERVLAPHGLTPAQFNVLVVLNVSPMTLHQRDILDLLVVEIAPPSLSSLLDRLERKGLVARRRDPLDSRAICVTLTEQGESFLMAAWPAYVAAMNRVFGAENSAALRSLARQLTAMTERAKQEGDKDV